MTDRKHYPRYDFREKALTVISAMPFLGMVAYFAIRGTPQFWGPLNTTVVVIGLASAAAASYRQFIYKRRMKCPKCKRMLYLHSPEKLNRGDPLIFFCEPCDTEWETGLHTPNDYDNFEDYGD